MLLIPPHGPLEPETSSDCMDVANGLKTSWFWFIPVGDWSLSDLDGAQLLDAALLTYSHVGVGDVEGLPLPAGAA